MNKVNPWPSDAYPPSVGRIVHYHMGPGDTRRTDQPPAIAPAIVTRVWWDVAAATLLVNLMLFRDLEAPMALSDVPYGTTPGSWSWPPRTSQLAAPVQAMAQADAD